MKKLAKLICAIVIISLLAIPVVGCAKPLSLAITSPTNASVVDKSPVEVRANVSDVKATVWVNDAIVPVTKYRAGGGFVSTKLDLNEGENTFIVTAARGKPGKWKDTVNWSVTVTYSPK